MSLIIPKNSKFRIGQEVIVKTKYAEPYKARIVGLWDMSQNGPYDEQGYLVKNIKGGGVESMPEHALSQVTAKDSAELNSDADLRAADAKDAAARDKAPDGWWEGKTIFAAFGWGKSVKGKVVSHRGGVIKLEDGTQFKESDAYDLYAIDSSASDAAELNNDADLRAALSKMADIAKRLTDAKVSFKAGWTPDGIGEIILDFPNIESARKYNYYKLFNAWDAARSQILPRWAVNIGGYRVPRIEGNRMTISILHFST